MDTRLATALTIQSNPGVYALLLGSGISRAAKIPTGWEVVLDLVRRVAALSGADSIDDPAKWYEEQFGEVPNYSKLLGQLAKRPDERQRLLRSYFEPTEEEHEEGLKQPTAAHAAVAKLCRLGYLRVVITTNFDRLLEQALSAEGLQPTVIASPDAVKGAPPLAHADLLIVKIHGDYLDTRIRNTTGELASYPRALDKLLDQIFAEFGLLVCGWSGQWDPALRRALERCRSQRYATYWTTVGDPPAELHPLLRLRRAETIKIESADEFFGDLAEKVVALEESARPHPISVETGVATLKRYLSNPIHDIRCHDLLMTETTVLLTKLRDDNRFSLESQATHQMFSERVQAMEGVSELLRGLVATAGFWGQQRHKLMLTRLIERLSTHESRGGYTVLLNLRYYPALLAMYAAGVAAVANRNYGALHAVLVDAQVVRDNSLKPVVLALIKDEILSDSQAQHLPGMDRHRTATSQWVERAISASFELLHIGTEQYGPAFDRFEYLLGIVHTDLSGSSAPDRIWGPTGNFMWRVSSSRPHPARSIAQEMESQGTNWEPLKHGFFGGQLARARQAKTNFDSFWQGMRYW